MKSTQPLCVSNRCWGCSRFCLWQFKSWIGLLSQKDLTCWEHISSEGISQHLAWNILVILHDKNVQVHTERRHRERNQSRRTGIKSLSIFTAQSWSVTRETPKPKEIVECNPEQCSVGGPDGICHCSFYFWTYTNCYGLHPKNMKIMRCDARRLSFIALLNLSLFFFLVT